MLARRRFASTLPLLALPLAASMAHAQTWKADLGNGTFSNPLFYEEFSDPDMIRVGKDFYATTTTMHSMPGLPVLHSRDLVNWTFESYALDRLDLGPEYRLENGGQIYGRGIWAPSLRYHDGTFYIFSNVNGKTTQLFRSRSPQGPWTRTPMKRSFHDLSVLFDEDGKVYVVWDYQNVHFAQLDSTLTDIVPGSERIIIPASAGMGEGHHFYKIKGKYYITSAWYAGRMRLACARADRPEGPYEVNRAISIDEDFGVLRGYRMPNNGNDTTMPLRVNPPDPQSRGGISMHQGGIVDTPTGEWWGFSMMDANSVGRMTALSPVTWQDGWPYFGLPGNLGRTPRIWVKPHTGATSPPTAPYVRDDDFSGQLAHVWEWNHVPVDSAWSLQERPGFLRLHALPAADLWRARNTLTQRAIGPRSSPVAILETAGMEPGDVAGLALFNWPFAWIGVQRDSAGLTIAQFDRTDAAYARQPLRATRVWLRADCDFLTEKARFSYSTDGKTFKPLGGEFTMVFQLKTFQGVRFALFSYNAAGAPGGYADFDAFSVRQPNPRGITRPIPYGRAIAIATAAGKTPLTIGGQSAFQVVDRRLGRIALRTSAGYLSVDPSAAGRVALRRGQPTDAQTFQWIETPYGDLALLSLATHRYLHLDPATGALSADHLGPEPGRNDGAQFTWSVQR